jgi:putative ABC transport system ATP-binding protein
MIQMQRVTKRFPIGDQEVTAIDGLDLEVTAGEFLAVVGPSGSGKSSLLHLMGGLDTPSSGDISLGGRSMSRMTDDEITLFRRRHIGFVFQFFNLIPTLTAEENIALPLLLDGKRLRDVSARAAHVLDLVGMSHRRSHLPGQLSGGEMQRVAVARALVIEPLVLLADEPTGNLDSRSGTQVLELVCAAHDAGQTVVMVTHDPEAADYADRRITLIDGRIVGNACTTRDALRAPA